MAKQKKVIIKGVTEEIFQESFQNYAKLDAKQCSLLAKLDEEITKIRAKSESELSSIKEDKQKAFENIQIYCAENPELFEKRKSLETLHGTVGYRTGTPKLKNLKGFTWAAVTNLLKEFFPQYVRTVEEAAKDMLIANREILTPEDWKKIGVELVQDETFFVDTKKEKIA